MSSLLPALRSELTPATTRRGTVGLIGKLLPAIASLKVLRRLQVLGVPGRAAEQGPRDLLLVSPRGVWRRPV